MKLGAVLKIDDFTFPLLPKGSLDFSMDRSIGKLQFPGAPPIYQDMGLSEKTLDFTGSLIGDNAIDLSNTIESKHWSGQELQLSCGDIQKRVRIQTYAPKILRSDRVDYTIHLIVCYPESDLPDLANVYGQQATSAPATTTTPASLANTMDRSYTIKSGDTLWGIAAKQDVFGDGTKWELIAKANAISDEYSLQAGQVIKIPSAGNVNASISAGTSQTSAVLGTTGQSELQIIAGRAA